MKKLYEQIANAIQARANCAKKLDTHREWFERWGDQLEHIAKNVLPSGSGFDRGTKFDLDRSNADRIVMETSFRPMDDSGSYCGWTHYTVTIRPAFIGGFDISVVSGRNRHDIKDYIAEVFQSVLSGDAIEINQI